MCGPDTILEKQPSRRLKLNVVKISFEKIEFFSVWLLIGKFPFVETDCKTGLTGREYPKREREREYGIKLR